MGHAPIKYTCPDIDKVISGIKAAIKECDYSRYSEVWDIKDYQATLDSIERILSGLESKMEDLRKDNSTLRDWGHEQSDRADKLETELEELKEQIATP